jgi:pimeloyl-ACP methyl ester carboxylesterase
MNTTTEGFIDVPGAKLFCKTRGTGPALLTLPGGGGNADGSDALADALASRYTVIAYDRRGLSRSPAGDREPGIGTHSDDASRLLTALTDKPAFVFGSSLGALIGLDLITAHPQQVRLLVAHEAACAALLGEPERSQFLATQHDVEDTFTREGLRPAMRKLFTIAAGYGDDPEPETARPPLTSEQTAQHAANMQFFLTHDAPAAHRYQPDLAALKATAASIIPAAGMLSRGSFPYRCAQALADHLGRPLTEFPGNHSGCALRPRAFAETLHQAFIQHAAPGAAGAGVVRH